MSTSTSTVFRNLELTSEQADAMGLGGEDFDYGAVERALDGRADADAEDDAAIPPEVLAGFGAMLGVLIDTVIPPGGRCPHPQAIGIRVLALLQLVRPEALAGKSMNEIANETGITRAALSKALVAYSDTFQFCARFQPGLKSRRTYADVQRVNHARRRRLRVLAGTADDASEVAGAGPA